LNMGVCRKEAKARHTERRCCEGRPIYVRWPWAFVRGATLAALGEQPYTGQRKALFYWQFGVAMTDTILKDQNPKNIEITPEMIAAGEAAYYALERYHDDPPIDGSALRTIYLAMEAARRPSVSSAA